MKKHIKLIIALALVALILFVPIPVSMARDGGTRVYAALTYKVVVWNRILDEDGVYRKTSVYLFPDNFKTIDELWALEAPET